MATEVEIRALIGDAVTFRAVLESNGFRKHTEYDQRDIVLDLPDGSLFRAGRKIRLRIEGNQAELTYKGPPTGDGSASRRNEIDVSFAPAQVDDYVALFEQLGYPVLYQVRKRREIFRLDEIKVTLDLWPIIGYLAEIEGAETSIKEIATRLFPGIEFRNFRLRDLFAIVCERRGKTLEALVNEHDQSNDYKLGNLARLF